MYLSDRDLAFAVKTGQLIVDPAPEQYDTSSIDLHLDRIEEARIWNVRAYEKQQQDAGNELATVGIGTFNHQVFAKQFNSPIPEEDGGGAQPVFRRGLSVILRPGGFFLWQTKEQVGTPEEDPRLICFIDGKSTKARTGLLVHMTAPTIHAGWWGKVTLEISNLGPFTLALKEGDAVAQIVVAALTSPPTKRKAPKGVAVGQANVAGQTQ